DRDPGAGRAEGETGQRVAPHVAGAEQVLRAAPGLPCGRTEAVAEHADLGVVGRDDVGEDRRERDDADDDHGDPGKALDPKRGNPPGHLGGGDSGAVHGLTYLSNRMRGSITAYRTSTRKRTTTTMAPLMRTVAWTTGKSRKEMPSKSSRPTPGHAKTVSTTTATLTMMTRLMPASVSTGMSAFLNACLAMTSASGRPLRRASFTYSEPSTSSMAERVSLMWAAAKYQPSANAGMMRWSGVPAPDDGSQPRYTEKNRIITRPT